jgi:putative hemolysin
MPTLSGAQPSASSPASAGSQTRSRKLDRRRAIAAVTVVLTFVTLVFGELAPKRLAMQYALRWALLVARPLNLLSAISRPAVWALSASTNLVVRLFGGNPHAESDQLSPEELRELVSSQRGLNPEQRMIISGALEIHERRLREVLVPRRAVSALDADLDMPRARTELAASGHSRAPRRGPVTSMTSSVW